MGNIYLGNNPVGKIYLGGTLILDNTGGGSAPLDWSVLPNVPVSQRSGIEAAINTLPYNGQFVLDTLATCNAWWDFRHFGTMFADSGFATPITATGQTVGGVKSWTDGANNLIQATSGKRAQTTAIGLLFDGIDDALTSSGLTIPDLNNCFVSVVAKPRRDLRTNSGALIYIGNRAINASGLGFGDGTLDSNTNNTLVGLREDLAWLPSSIAVGTALTRIRLEHRNGLFQGLYGGSSYTAQTFTPNASIVTIGGYPSGNIRHLACEVAGVIVGPSSNQFAANTISDFMAAYYI